MAYKFQRGSAILSGALIQDSNVTAQGSATGTLISVDGTGQGLEAGDDIIINGGNLSVDHTPNHGLDMYVGSTPRAQITGSQTTFVKLVVSNDSEEEVLKMGAANLDAEGILNTGFLQQFSSGGGAHVAILSGSGDGKVASATFFGNLNVGGNLTVGGNLAVSGSLTTISSTDVRIKDPVAHIAKDATNKATSVDSGFKVGTTSNNIGQIVLKDNAFSSDISISDTTFIGLFGDNVAISDYINLEADKFYGNGAGLTGLTGAPTYSVTEKNSGTIVAGVNYVTNNAAVTLTMPAASGEASGTIYKIKSYNENHSSTKKITINTASGADKIDGQNSIELENAFASVTLIRTGANLYSII